GILVPFRGSLSSANAALILVAVVVAVASLGNRVAGALAAVSAAVWLDLFLTRPYESLKISNGNDIATAVLMLVVGLAVSQLAAYARRLRVVTITNADHLMQVQQTVQLVQSGAEVNTVVRQVQAQLIELLGLSDCRFEYGVLLGQHRRLTRDGEVTPGRARQSGDIELRVEAGDRYSGRHLLQPPP